MLAVGNKSTLRPWHIKIVKRGSKKILAKYQNFPLWSQPCPSHVYSYHTIKFTPSRKRFFKMMAGQNF